MDGNLARERAAIRVAKDGPRINYELKPCLAAEERTGDHVIVETRSACPTLDTAQYSIRNSTTDRQGRVRRGLRKPYCALRNVERLF
jgi:hypothetical protein